MLFFITVTWCQETSLHLGTSMTALGRQMENHQERVSEGSPDLGDFAGLVSKSWALGAKLGSLFIWGRSIWGTCLFVSCCSDSGSWVLEHCALRVRWRALIKASDTLEIESEMSVVGKNKTSDLKETKKGSFLKVTIPLWKVMEPLLQTP